MWLETAVLSLNGGIGLVQQDFYLGQPLLRRPKQNGSAVATITANRYQRYEYICGAAPRRGTRITGASAGLFWNPGYKNIGINVNYRLRSNLTVYANLRNALDGITKRFMDIRRLC